MNRTDLFRDLRIGATGVVLGLIFAGSVWVYTTLHKNSAPSVEASPAPEIAGQKTTTLPCQDVEVYSAKVAKRLGVTPAPGQHVTSAAVIPPSDRPRTWSSLFDEQTGRTTPLLRDDPRPWLAAERHTLLGVFLVARDEAAEPVGELLGLHDFAQIKALNLGAMGHIDTTGRRAIGGGIWASW